MKLVYIVYITVAQAFMGSGVSTTDENADVSKYFKLECKDVPLSVPPWEYSWRKGILSPVKYFFAHFSKYCQGQYL